ncbi:SAM-dependent methyltransferase [Spongorhabdus nitratireducens]
MDFIWLIVATAVAVTLSIIFYTLKLGIGPVPTAQPVRHGVAALLDSAPGLDRKPETVLELGSGWGGMLLWLACRYPQACIIGYERSLIPWFVTLLRIRFSRLSHRVRVERKDFMQAKLPAAGLIYCYLYRDGMRQLADKFEKAPATDSWLISSTFALPGFTPAAEQRCGDLYRTPVYAYRLAS